MSEFLQVALEYAKRWSIIPIQADKRPVLRWKPYQLKSASADQVKEWFSRPDLSGLAVICGPVSSDLVVRDFDNIAAYAAWESSHPELAAKLPTVATARGRHVYFRTQGIGLVKEVDGEVRGQGAYVILPPSRHPTGYVYRWLIPLPDGPLPAVDDLLEAGLMSQSQRSQRSQQSLTEPTKAIEERVITPAVEEAVRRTLPTGPGMRNAKLFDLARELMGIEGITSLPASALRPIIKRWHQLAVPIIRTKELADSWADFLRARKSARHVMGAAILSDAWNRAKASPPPPETSDYGRAVRRLASLCRELQRSAGPNPFWLSCASAEALVGVDRRRIHRWLLMLVEDGLLVIVQRGTAGVAKGGKATRFRYLGPLEVSATMLTDAPHIPLSGPSLN